MSSAHANDSSDPSQTVQTSSSLIPQWVSDAREVQSASNFSLSDINAPGENIWVDEVPPELWIKIFHLLPQSDLLFHVPQVCRAWYQVSRSPILRTRLVLRRDVPPDVLYEQFKTRPLMRLFHCTAMESAGSALVSAIQLSTSLQCLNIGFCKLSEELLDTLSTHLPPTLVHLNVEGIKTIGLHFISNLVTRCPKLEALNLSHCVAVCNQCVRLLCDTLTTLRRLNLDGALWFTDEALQYLADSCRTPGNSGIGDFLRRLSETNKELEKCLNVRILTHTEEYPNDTENPLGLHVLWFSFCDNFTNVTVKPIRDLTGLTALTLRKAKGVTSDGWKDLFVLESGSPNLSLQWLEHVDLSEAPDVNDAVVSCLCKCCGSRLRSLALNWCWCVSDNGLETIVTECPMMRHLSLIGNHTINGRALSFIPTSQPLMNVVNLTQCNRVIDSILEDLVQQMPHLHVFDYSGEPVGNELKDFCHYDLWRSLRKVPICAD
ncbi:unnamed protein product [Echinostoma caproni]|uniref:F-box domain-containing protein n=1 Tax=Echinostoma caproni TaxID=27848 RepID=A0A183AQ42_9TREM|nr:unnamed protein product [Echinostoma caproni]